MQNFHKGLTFAILVCSGKLRKFILAYLSNTSTDIDILMCKNLIFANIKPDANHTYEKFKPWINT